MNSTEKKALIELSQNLEDVQAWTKTIKSTVDCLKNGTEEHNVQEIFEDTHLNRTLTWLTDSVDNVKMLMRILK